ncbi:Asp-tRNA(Asn)/Glu-tRNA(Gln) amidotransferase subunit GatA [Anaplasma marginale]|uniref:Asp-tRNA(Asn)/Glu-tRNA(Gln) amidotransferase subunit GatA n=1 Tax=Anaplasma marginale TaxID=770 RepID=UPI0011EEF925|nr:Asp-tRNA(Asn)/Glu-tRNA(Gln) amidotransferase subunit GatA [Anaplasma marginale]TZF78185.1 Asp-tRNA(Asn)/Glu-tRNA(Gln) amidotransferase subunit GatA [Anaplasma marginale]
MKRELLKLSILEAHRCLKNKDFSARELTEAYIGAVEQDTLNAFVTTTPELALAAADRTDGLLQRGEPIHPMSGIPVGVKDLFCTKGVRTTACSNILKNFVPTYESTVSQKLWDSGAVMLGKLNMDEFAMGSSNTYSCFGPVKNPWKGTEGKDLTPGGSSGGSSAAVAGLLCAGALGSDTGGSVRQPAALCGVVGAKPTYGRCSRWGMIAYASSLDQAGVLARTVEDAAVMLNAICGYDQKDSTSSQEAAPDFLGGISRDVRGVRIGIPKEYELPKNRGDIAAMWDQNIKHLLDCGAEIVEISLPHTTYALPVYYILASSEASSNLARYDGIRYGTRVEGETIDEMYELTRSLNFGEEVKRRMLIGAYTLSSGYRRAYYDKAQRVRCLVIRDFEEAFKKVDCILALTTPVEATGIEEPLSAMDRYFTDVFTVPASLAGLPAISVPAGLSERKLPMALQVIGHYHDECGMLNLAAVIYEHSGGVLQHLHGF